jgi:dihydroorotate dehydrogenase
LLCNPFPAWRLFALNVSSPNTPQLRDLQEKSLLRELLSAVQERNRELAASAQISPKPLFVKIAPDMEFAQVDEIVEVAAAAKINRNRCDQRDGVHARRA